MLVGFDSKAWAQLLINGLAYRPSPGHGCWIISKPNPVWASLKGSRGHPAQSHPYYTVFTVICDLQYVSLAMLFSKKINCMEYGSYFGGPLNQAGQGGPLFLHKAICNPQPRSIVIVSVRQWASFGA